jgi:hypothetical protein
MSVRGQVRPRARRHDHSRTAPASGRPHANVIIRRMVTGKDRRLPVTRTTPSHSHSVPEPAVSECTRCEAAASRIASRSSWAIQSLGHCSVPALFWCDDRQARDLSQQIPGSSVRKPAPNRPPKHQKAISYPRRGLTLTREMMLCSLV